MMTSACVDKELSLCLKIEIIITEVTNEGLCFDCSWLPTITMIIMTATIVKCSFRTGGLQYRARRDT